MKTRKCECLVIGSGLAGTAYACFAAQRGLKVTILTNELEPKRLANSDWAQGGIIYNISENLNALKNDILSASENTAFPESVDRLVQYGKEAVEDFLLNTVNVPFDRDVNGDLAFTREGGHSESRIIFSKDHTGHSILQSVHDYARQHKNIEWVYGHTAIDLLTLSHNSLNPRDRYHEPTCIGAYALNSQTNEVLAFVARKTILATGGVGQVFLHSTNQRGSVGNGIAMAYRTGARVIDMEYIQFHPTVFYRKHCPRFLISEAVRGEGAILVNSIGEAFMEGQHPMAHLAPRDVVSRAIYEELIKSGEQCVYLDLSTLKKGFFDERFPSIAEKCRQYGIDPNKDRIPVVPAAHYCCGGIWAKMNGRTTVKNLNAIGETACTGLHGANRLASTSLLECLVMARLAAANDKEDLSCNNLPDIPKINSWVSPDAEPDPVLIDQDMKLIQNTLWNYVGLARSPRRLKRARQILRELQYEVDSFYSGYRLTEALIELRNAVQTALIIVHAASLNRVSQGCHFLIKDPAPPPREKPIRMPSS